MAAALEAFELLGLALDEPWYVVNSAEQVVRCNAAFEALLQEAGMPSPIAGGLTCRQLLSFRPCQPPNCLRERCRGGKVSLERVRAKAGTRELELSVLAVPLQLDDGPGALIVLRDDTDSVRLQTRYQRLLETVEGERARYQAQLDERTRELLAANEELTRLERELASALRERAFSRT